MKALLIVGGVIVALPLAVVSIYGIVRTQKVESDPRQKAFREGKAPAAPLDGLYRGSLQGREVSWKGKKFAPAESRGINVFLTKEGRLEERYPFRTYVGRGVKDKKIEVLKIDYGLKGNPWWLRRVLDEVVEVAPGRLLGKVHLKWIFGMTFTMGYFELDQASAAEETAPGASITPEPPAPDESEPVPASVG
jgi:hypothetical protein